MAKKWEFESWQRFKMNMVNNDFDVNFLFFFISYQTITFDQYDRKHNNKINILLQ